MKQIKVKDDTWKWLSKIKINFDLRSLDHVISKMQKLINKLSLMKDFEIMVQSEIKINK